MEMGGWHKERMKYKGFDRIQRGNYFRGEHIGRAEFEVRVG